MKIVVTGGAGFLGSHVVDALIARGDQVIVIDHYQKDKRRFLNSQAHLFKLSFGDPQVADILKEHKPDAVVHLAAQISVTKSIADPLQDLKQNLTDSLNLLTWSAEAGVKKIVFASSAGAIYGDHPKRPTPVLTDSSPLSPYGLGKQSFERYLEHFYQAQGLSYVSLRFANLYGPRQQVVKPVGEGNVVSLFLDRLLVTGEPIIIFGDGSTTRDYVYVDDAVDAILKALDQPVVGLINVGTGKATSVNDLLAELIKLHGRDHPVEYKPFRTGEVLHSHISPKTAKVGLGWRPLTNLKRGLKKTYLWYKHEFSGK